MEELNITAKGSLQNRIYLNNDRLHSDYYSEKNFIQDNEYSWPGDFEGRTLLALVSLAKALHKQEFPEKLFLLAKEHVNQDKYFGKLFDGKVANEQQISGNSWYLRALVAIYEEYKDTFAYESICSIIDNFVVKLLPFYKKYPMESKYRDNTNKGEAIGALYTKTVNDWYLSTDTGCAFIALDGFTSAYSIYPNQDLKQLIEFMIEKFMSIDKVGLRCQTHATLSASRGIMRFYEITQQDKYLDYVKGIFDLYLQNGMTCNYANYNWFLRPSWTEPCAIVDSLILAFSLFRETGEYRYAQVVNRIYANALRFAQRGNGGFGCDVCLDENENYLKPNQNFYEAFWCCTMRGAEGLLWCVENIVQSKGNTVTVVCAEDCNVVSKDGKIQFSLAVEKGRQNVLSLESLVVEVFIRVVGIASVHGGGLDVFVKRMPRPEHDRLQIATCLFRPGNVGIAEFMGMMLGEQSLERRLYRTQVYRFCFFKIDVWKNFSKHRGEGGFAFDFYSSLSLFARGADEEVLFRAYGFEFTPAQTAIEHDE